MGCLADRRPGHALVLPRRSPRPHLGPHPRPKTGGSMKFAAYVLLTFLIGSAARAADLDWPEFRGPTQQGHSTSTNLPLTWSETEHVKFKTPIPGRGWSSPVIFGDQVWMT